MIKASGMIVSWFLLMTIPVFVLLTAGLRKLYVARKKNLKKKQIVPERKVEIFVPVKGLVPNQEAIFSSLLEQTYDSYQVLFILETPEDPANDFIETLCSCYQHAHKIISGIGKSCGQKNHNLVQGVLHMRPETEIIVFCDSTNVAPLDWLRQFTRPIRQGICDAVTSFRIFCPEPENMIGVCQAVYGALVFLLTIVVPKPWGGATAIRRSTFDRLNVAEAWSKTVVDDLVLGNILERSRIRVRMDPCSALRSPLRNQNLAGFLGYLDRQVLFPKFTNPVIWAGLSVLYMNLFVAIPSAILFAATHTFGLTPDGIVAWFSATFICGLLVLAGTVRRMLTPHISLSKWFLAVFCFLALGSFIVMRSIVKKHINWHGRTYWCGKGGQVLMIK